MRQLPWKTTVSRCLDSRHLLVGTVGAPRQAQGLRSCMCACVGGLPRVRATHKGPVYLRRESRVWAAPWSMREEGDGRGVGG